jgi:catechol 2,3-dioxygenase-like lactoylglutathione lyase family enzyme
MPLIIRRPQRDREDLAREGRCGITGGTACVYVDDLDDAVYFYEKTLGLRLATREGDTFASIDAGGLFILLYPKAADSPKPGTAGSSHICFGIDRPIEDVIKVLRHRDVRFDDGIRKDDFARTAFFRDPDGNQLCLREYRSAARRLVGQERRYRGK